MKIEQSKLVLREDRIVETVARLEKRIGDRFPDSGLSKLCAQLLEIAKQTSERSAWIGNPIRSIRIAGYLIAAVLIAMFLGVIIYGIQNSESDRIDLIELIQVIEPGLNVVILIAIAVWFFVSLESRIKRRRALHSVHQLRSLAHVVDMHQLTKDPDRILGLTSATEHSPKESMTPQQLNRYLDYCSEMLSLIGKIASLYVQRFDDPQAVAAVSEVEQLTTGLSRKIWQKIMILNQVRESLPQEQPSQVSSQPTKAEPAATQ